MNTDSDNFRILVVLALATLGLSWIVSLNASPPPEQLQTFYQWHGFGAVIPGTLEAYWALVESAITVVSLLGMFFFLRYARALLLVAIFMAPLRAGLGGIWVSSPVEDAMFSLHMIFLMFVVGMAFFHPPIRSAFHSRDRSEHAKDRPLHS
jgi:hypothetical protein